MLVKKVMGAGGLVGGGTPPTGDDYWVVEVSDVRRLGDVIVNSSNDVIAAFEDAQAVAVVSLDKDGVENWQKKYSYSTYDSAGFKWIGVDSSDNIYISTYYDLGLGASRDAALLKLSASTQAVLAQAGIASSVFDAGYKVSVDSSDNIYQAIYYNDGTVGTAGLAKYDSSLSLDWIYKFNDGTNASLFWATTVDSSGYIYAGGYAKEAGTYEYRPFLVKLNSSGTVQWSVKTTNTISTLQNGEDYGGLIRDIIVDSSDNVYISIATTVSGSGFTKRLHVLKFNSSGTVQWHKQFSSTGTYPAGGSGNNIDMCITTGGVLVVCWDDATEIPATTAIVGLNPSDGSVSWQRTINKKSYNSLHAHPLGGWCFSIADGSSPYGGYIARLPDDGSLTGNWGNLSYNSSSRWVSATGGMIWGASTIAAVSDSPTETTPSYAASTSSYTLTKTTDPTVPVLKGFVTKAVDRGSNWNSGSVLDVLSIADEGDLVVIAFSVDNSTTSWNWEGMAFTAIENLTNQASPGTYVGYRVVQAGDANPYLGGSVDSFRQLTAIAAVFEPTYTTFENSDYSNGSGSSLDPPAVTATADLWIITGHLDDDYNSTFTAPSGYELIGTAGDPSVGSGTCMCYKEESLTSENPGAITSSTSDGWYATTVAFS
jgi:hypothetical protein